LKLAMTLGEPPTTGTENIGVVKGGEIGNLGLQKSRRRQQ
jgi:hypothetical protein